MQPSRLIASFSLFRQRPPKGFDLPTRYYDPARDRRREREAAIKAELEEGAPASFDRGRFSSKVREAWQPRRRDAGYPVRLLLTLGLVMAMLYIVYRNFFPHG